MNVYNRATGWGSLITLLLLAAALVLDGWLMSEFPILQHGLGYAMLQVAMLALFLKVLYLIFRGGSPPAQN
jgi:hypothetical protein